MPFFTNPNDLVCLDIGCGVTLVDRVWLVKKLSSQKISVILVLLKIRDIGALKYESRNFALTIIYISGIIKKDRKIYASISYKLYLVDGLKVNMLGSNNMFSIKGFAINLSNSSVLIHSYGMKINLNTRQYSKFLKQRVLANGSTLVLPQSKALVAFQYIDLSDFYNFLFYPSP